MKVVCPEEVAAAEERPRSLDSRCIRGAVWVPGSRRPDIVAADRPPKSERILGWAKNCIW